MTATTALESPSARTLANRRNAAKSTGPKTAEGKAASRRNAVKHGLAGQGVALPLAIQGEASSRAAMWIGCVGPVNAMESEIVTLAAHTYTQLTHGWHEELLARARAADRAELSWDLDRELDVSKVASRLSAEPGRTVTRLKQTAHGAAWLLTHWMDLAKRLEAGLDWDDDTRTFALDLLGTPEVFRDAYSPVDRPDLAEDPDALREHRLAVAKDQIQYLEDIIDNCLIPVDDDDRHLCLAGMAVVPDVHIARINRYRTNLYTRFTALMARIGKPLGGTRPVANETNPGPVAAPFIAPISAAETNPPAHLADHKSESDAAALSALLIAQQSRPITPLREAADGTNPIRPLEAPAAPLKAADETKPSARTVSPATTSAAPTADRYRLPDSYYRMSLEDLKTAGSFVNASDPQEVYAYGELLRSRLIEQDVWAESDQQATGPG